MNKTEVWKTSESFSYDRLVFRMHKGLRQIHHWKATIIDSVSINADKTPDWNNNTFRFSWTEVTIQAVKSVPNNKKLNGHDQNYDTIATTIAIDIRRQINLRTNLCTTLFPIFSFPQASTCEMETVTMPFQTADGRAKAIKYWMVFNAIS